MATQCPRGLWLMVLITSLLSLLPPPLAAQTVHYEYDALGRLTVVSTPEGVAIYEYDAVGNILRITTQRYTEVPGPVAILGVSPDRGAPGTGVTLYGKGFVPRPSDNQVTFNGVVAPVTAVSESTLTTVVPPGATTGSVSLTTAQGTATSPGPFTVLQAFAVSPDQADAALGGSVGFQATLGGAPTSEVTWRVNGIVGGNAALGAISPTGTYTAPTGPPAIQPVPIEAVLTADPTQLARASVRTAGQLSGLEAAAAVSVRVEAQAGPTASAPVSVQVLPASGPAASGPVSVALLSVSDPTASPPVAVYAGPVLSAIAPSAAPAGSSSLALTLTGANLQGASAVQILRNGSVDPTLTVTSVVPTGEGTSVSCTLTISGGASPGARILRVVTPQGTSTAFDLGTNTFTVTAP